MALDIKDRRANYLFRVRSLLGFGKAPSPLLMQYNEDTLEFVAKWLYYSHNHGFETAKDFSNMEMWENTGPKGQMTYKRAAQDLLDRINS